MLSFFEKRITFAKFGEALLRKSYNKRRLRLKDKLYHNSQSEGRVNFTTSKYLSRVKIFLTFFVAAIFTLIVIGFIREGVTYLSLAAAFGAAFLAFLVVKYISKHSQTASIKGDNLILNSMGHKSSVMPIRCVKSAKTRKILGTCFTTINYLIDGRAGWIFMITAKCDNLPQDIILEAKDSVKNKKANHKPGSVITQQA